MVKKERATSMASIVGSLKLSTKSAEVGKAIGFAIPVLAILISVGVAFFVVWPKFNEVLKLKDTNKQNAELSKKLEDKASKLSALDASKLTQQITNAEQLLPSEKSIFTMLRQIENTAGSSGVLISSLSVVPGAIGKSDGKDNSAAGVAPPAPPTKDSVDPPDVSKIVFRLALTSDYKGLLSFLGGLSSIPRVVAIKDLSVGSGGSSSTQGSETQLSYSFELDSYWQAIPSELPSIESPIIELTKDQEAILAKVSNNASVTSSLPPPPFGRTDLFAPF